MRLDKFLSEKHQVSRQYIQKLIEDGQVTIAGRPVRKNQAADEKDVIRINWPSPVKLAVPPEEIPLEIIYQDEDLVVINKPAGLVCHPHGRVTSGTMVNALLYCLKDLSAIGGTLRPGIVHRLDKETSGLMVVAKNDFSHRFLSDEFRFRRVKKKYLAFVKGVIPWPEQEISLPLGHKRGDWMRIGVAFQDGKESQTLVKVKERYPAASLVEVYPKTGRTHQIRVTLDFLGFPIIGDKRYGKVNPLDQLIGRQALHAAGLSFRHPRRESMLSFDEPLPPDLVNLQKDLT
ncbi:MAG: RluA family pseudouridine synthase [Candidatus Omnitrophica bacterium]|nr:RluA family pseudouridine synthase [Candidatus Omnitrophota bacterium]